ncbi:MAG: single-stranded-DNA-specific exonuclease RecJ [Lachnospiraceae bacterium]|nr:single-stranded-DNA-specific exonuclease RecJ [Lachnospiraceae bacterium]
MSQWMIQMKSADYKALTEKYGISPMLARIIRNRGMVTDEEFGQYLNGTLDDLHDTSKMTDMVKACSLIQQYISEGLKFRIIGDYDVDGICSTYILMRGLKKCGADVDYAIPHRVHDGYGINDNLIDKAHEDGINVIITCDNGIAACDQVQHAYNLGIHVIVTDHHEIPYDEDEDTGERLEILPPAEAVVDPHREDDKYPFSGICGAVVAWKLIGLLLPMCGMSRTESDTLTGELLEEAALATVCDVMELKDENRIIVKEGLRRIQNTTNTGLRSLINAVGLDGKKITTYSFGFILGPCMNAAGRLDSASASLELLLSEDKNEAALIAGKLKSYNDERKAVTETGIKRAIEDIENSPVGRNKVLVIYLAGVHESVVGLIAGKIRERYEKPVIVFTDGEEGIKGSGRSIEAYNMYEELAKHKDLYSKFGGHKMAAGLTLAGDDVDELRYRLNAACTLSDDDLVTKTMIDLEMPFKYVTYSFIEELTRLEPCGNGNPRPVFALRGLRVERVKRGGNERSPLNVYVRDADNRRWNLKLFDRENAFLDGADAVYGMGTAGDLCDGTAEGVIIDVIYNPAVNEYRGESNLELTVNDYRFKKEDQDV